MTHIHELYLLTCRILGGVINLKGKSSLPEGELPIEYLLAHYGTKVPYVL